MKNSRIFESLCHNGLLEIYAQEDDSKFDLGNLLYFDDEWLLLECFDNFGNFDGYMLLSLESVFKVNYQTKYTKDLGKIIQSPQKPLQIVSTQTDLLHQLLVSLQKNGIVSVTLSNGDVIIGEILSTEDSLVCIKVFCDDGTEDGVSMFSSDMISSVQFETVECKAIQRNKTVLEKKAGHLL